MQSNTETAYVINTGDSIMQRGLYCETFVLFLSISLIFDLNSIPSGIKKMHAIFFFSFKQRIILPQRGIV